MNASEAFVAFVARVLVPAKARRLAALASTKKGQKKIVHGFSHDFEPAVRPAAIHQRDYNKLWGQPCFVFHSPLGFGVEFSTVRDAYDRLSLVDDWLIVLQDGTAGIYRPEARWDGEMLIA
jgi:hypothetical protein